MTMKKNERFSRRAVLKGLGASTMMLPLLRAERSVAQTATPKRLVCITMTNGNVVDDFHAFHAGGGQTLSPLAPWKDQVNTIRGAGYHVMDDEGQRWGGHRSFSSILTGSFRQGAENKTSSARNASLDQVVANHFAQTAALPRNYLNLGVKSEQGGWPPTSWRDDMQPNANETDSERLFESLFASAAMPPETIDALRQKRGSILDYLGRDLEAFGTRMGTEDKAKIEAHLTSIRELEVELENEASLVCDAPDVLLGDYAPDRMASMFRMMSAALRCDFTRVITIEMYNNGGGNGNTFPWLNVNRDYHELAHAGEESYADKVIVDRWLFEQIVPLVSDLAGTSEGDGTMLDNSLILVSNDMEKGENHNTRHISFATIGNAGGYFNTGRAFDVGEEPHNKLLTTIANSMGVETNQIGSSYSGTLPTLLA